MELELKFAELACCEPVGDLVTTQEESMETAIPEYCPDIARIVDTVGQLRLREKHPAGQQLTMGGSVVLTVLYTSEESAGLRSLSMEVPFSCQVEDKRLAGCDAVCVTGRLLLAEAKAVTARKLYLRVMPEFTVSGYARRRQRLCCGTEEDPALRVRRQEAELELLTAPEERELIRHLAALTDDVVTAAKTYDPAKITHYVIDLATLFHKFYNAQRVMVEDEGLMQARLYLCTAVKNTIRNVLTMLKISVPERM